jgi:hypothetical protein
MRSCAEPADRKRVSGAGKKRLAAAAACILVAACAGTIKEEMAKLEGQPLSAIIAKIGQPMGERSIAGKRVYLLGYATSLSSKSDRGPQCQIEATMNGDVVERLAYEGDEALCLKYAARLRS